MADVDRMIFLSYRREVSWATAQLVRDKLVALGFDVFLDVHGIGSGEFELVILREIERRRHFLVLLEPRSLDGIGQEGNWLRREIAHALTHRRNVVPVLANGARMPGAAKLPSDIVRLPAYNAVSVPHEYVDAAIERLRERFLRPSDSALRAAASDAGCLDDPITWPQATTLGAPNLSVPRGSPLAVAVPPLAVSVEWTAVDGATHYEVQRAYKADFAVESVGRTKHAATHLLISRVDLATRGRFVRVRAVGACSAGPWSNAVELR